MVLAFWRVWLVWLGALVVFGTILVGLSRPAGAEVGAYLVFDLDTGDVVAQHQASALWFPASVTKLMTAHVTLQAVERGELTMRSPVRMSVQATQQPPSKMGFRAGTVITIETALRIILTKSANDVSVALAEAVGGTASGFMARMNATAAELGMVDTRYDNPHGLPNRLQVTTARDTGLLMSDLVRRFPDHADLFNMSGVRLGNRTFRNHNVLIRRFPGATGMKTGFICSSGFNIAASARGDGRHLGAVVFGGLTGRERNERTAELLAKGFEAAANGGIVALDGFGDLEDRLGHEPVVGQRLAQGTVTALPAAGPDAVVTDLKSIVCGNARPPTRYDDGTVSTVAALDEERVAYAAWQLEVAARQDAIDAILHGDGRGTEDGGSADAGRGMPIATHGAAAQQLGQGDSSDAVSPLPAPPQEFVRRLADDALRVEAFSPSTEWARIPMRRPGRQPAAILAVADFAPEGWVARGLKPLANPLAKAGLRAPLPTRPARLPLTYLSPARSIPPVAIAIGGAEQSRPEPLSGSVVGGGLAPMPLAKPPSQTSI